MAEDLVPCRYTDVREGLTPPVGGVPHRVRSENGAAFGRAAPVPTRESPWGKQVHVGPQQEAMLEAFDLRRLVMIYVRRAFVGL